MITSIDKENCGDYTNIMKDSKDSSTMFAVGINYIN